MPKPAQFAHWRELICEAFLDLTPESQQRDGFAGQVTQFGLGGPSAARSNPGALSNLGAPSVAKRSSLGGPPPGESSDGEPDADRTGAEVAIARIQSQAQRGRRTPRDIGRIERSGYYANLQVRGESLMSQGGRSTVLRPGDLAIVDTTEPFTFGFRDNFLQLSFHIPQELLHAQAEQSVPTATRISTATGIGAALRHALQ